MPIMLKTACWLLGITDQGISSTPAIGASRNRCRFYTLETPW
jgi:hypothetical protein